MRTVKLLHSHLVSYKMKPSRHIATILLPEIFLHSDEYGKAAADGSTVKIPIYRFHLQQE